MKVLIYERTHKGDPDERGIFGVQDCMGSIRNWNYDAVIGIGGKRPWKEDSDIRQKFNWVGIGPKRIKGVKRKRGNIVVFSHFRLLEETGAILEHDFPNLAAYMYGDGKRFTMSHRLPLLALKEVEQILTMSRSYPPSKDFSITDDPEKLVRQEEDCTCVCFDQKKGHSSPCCSKSVR